MLREREVDNLDQMTEEEVNYVTVTFRTRGVSACGEPSILNFCILAEDIFNHIYFISSRIC